jgi:hypothetical protein
MAQKGTRSATQTPVRGMSEAELLASPLMVPLDTSNRALNLGRTTGFRLAKIGEYPVKVHRLGNQYRVARADLLRFLGIETGEAPERSDAA